MKIADCPFCGGDIDGCCFCDHTGKIEVGDGFLFNSEADVDFSKQHINEEQYLRELHTVNGIKNKLNS